MVVRTHHTVSDGLYRPFPLASCVVPVFVLTLLFSSHTLSPHPSPVSYGSIYSTLLYSTIYATRSAPPHIHTYYDQAIGEEGDLEVYPRLDGDLYVNGFANEEGRCREPPNEERIEDEKIQQLRAAMELVYGRPKLDEMNDEENEAMDDNDDDDRPTPPSPRAVEHTQQVCYWPETPDGLPILGKIPAIEGVYVAGTGYDDDAERSESNF